MELLPHQRQELRQVQPRRVVLGPRVLQPRLGVHLGRNEGLEFMISTVAARDNGFLVPVFCHNALFIFNVATFQSSSKLCLILLFRRLCGKQAQTSLRTTLDVDAHPLG